MNLSRSLCSQRGEYEEPFRAFKVPLSSKDNARYKDSGGNEEGLFPLSFPQNTHDPLSLATKRHGAEHRREIFHATSPKIPRLHSRVAPRWYAHLV